MDPERYRGFSTPELKPKDDFNVLPPPPPHNYSNKSKGSKKKLGYLIFALVVVLGIGLTLYLTHHPKAKKTNTNSSAPNSSVSTTPSTPKTPQIASTSYTSTTYNASFSYPSTWAVTDNGTGPLTVTSTPMQLESSSGTNVLGQIVLTLVSKGNLPKSFGTQAVAVLDSQKITYSAPSTTQAAASYISFAQYSTTVTPGGLDAIYLSGNFGYLKNQTIPATDLNTVDPLVYVSFNACASSQCPISTLKPLTISSAAWSDNNFSAPILLIFRSFSFD